MSKLKTAVSCGFNRALSLHAFVVAWLHWKTTTLHAVFLINWHLLTLWGGSNSKHFCMSHCTISEGIHPILLWVLFVSFETTSITTLACWRCYWCQEIEYNFKFKETRSHITVHLRKKMQLNIWTSDADNQAIGHLLQQKHLSILHLCWN